MKQDLGALTGSKASPQAKGLGPSGYDPERGATRVLLEASIEQAVVDDVSEVIARTRYITRYQPRHFGKGLASELADAVDRLNLKVADLREEYGESR